MARIEHIGLILALFILRDVCALSESRCEKIGAPMCQGLYNTTHMPNYVGDDNQRDAILGLQEYAGIIYHNCSSSLRLFVCSVHVPLCTEHVSIVPPCRPLCEEVRRNCFPILEKAGFEWPERFNCSRFPEPPDLCMQKPPEDEFSHTSENRLLSNADIKKAEEKFLSRCPPNRMEIGGGCSKPCTLTLKYVKEDQIIFEVWIIVWSIISLIVVIFALLTFIIQPKRFRWPARPILYLLICGFVISFTHFIRWAGGSLTCSDGIELSNPFETNLCITAALLLTYCDFAFSLWWFVFSYVWYLSASKEWSTEAIEKISMKIHSITWSVSLIPIVYILVSTNIQKNDLTGFCEIHSLVLVISQMIIVGFGIILAVLTSKALKDVKKALVYVGRSPYKLERLIYRLGIISLGISVPLFGSLLCNFFDSLQVELVKNGLKFLSIIVSSFWVFSYKTFRSWNKVLKPAFTHKGLRSVPVTKV